MALALCLLAVALAGCSTTKPKPAAKPEAATYHERGWIGGKFDLAEKKHTWLGFPSDPPMPKDPAVTNRAGLLITSLSTNTPASQAGLQAGDLILALNHQPVTTEKAFRKLVDAAKPGSPLSISAWRSGRTFDCDVAVGRELYERTAMFCISFPFYKYDDLGYFDLWPDPGFSLGFVLGFEPSDDERAELHSPKNEYRRAATGRDFTRSDKDWDAWLVFFSMQVSKTIHSQDIVPLGQTSPSPSDKDKH